MNRPLFSLLLIFCLLPVWSMAAVTIEPYVEPDENGVYLLPSGQSYVIIGDGTPTECSICVENKSDWWDIQASPIQVTLQNVHITSSSSPLTLKGNIILNLEGNNTLDASPSQDANALNYLDGEAEDCLIITGDGHLTAIGASGTFSSPGGCGIGSADGSSHYERLIIESGSFNVTGGFYRAGICSQSITINGGQITAAGGYHAAGIGSSAFPASQSEGDYSLISEIIINGGSIDAVGGVGSAAIGGVGSVEIRGGTIVRALGGVHDEYSGGGAGIGSNAGANANVFISGGTIELAEGGSGAAGIGGGCGGEGYVLISGGTICRAVGGQYSPESQKWPLFSGAGIGGGSHSDGDVIISDGNVKYAIGGKDAACIGGGIFGDGRIQVSDGNVNVSSEDPYSIGIGGGYEGKGFFTLCGGSVTAENSIGTLSVYSTDPHGLILIEDGTLQAANIIGDIIINGGTVYLGTPEIERAVLEGGIITVNGGEIYGGSFFSMIRGEQVVIRDGIVGSEKNVESYKDDDDAPETGFCIIGNSIRITGGRIAVQSTQELPGIGGYDGAYGDTLITGGHIIAHGSIGAAAIGRNDHCSPDITISGGTIIAYPGSWGAICGGQVTINDGKITAYSDGSLYDSALHADTLVINGGQILAYTNATNGTFGSAIHADTINGGQVTAYGSPFGPAISVSTINGGEINAYGGSFSAGIGSPFDEDLIPVVINGGTIRAQGGTCASGIGGSAGQPCMVEINGGSITAVGGASAPGIGPGASGFFHFDNIYDTVTTADAFGRVVLRGGEINAVGGVHAAGIGGARGSICTVEIQGSTIYAAGGLNAPAVGPGAGGQTRAEGDNFVLYEDEPDYSINLGTGTTTVSAPEDTPVSLYGRNAEIEDWAAITGLPFSGECADITEILKNYRYLNIKPSK